MTLHELTELAERGVRLSVDGDQLVVSAPKGELTERLRSWISGNRDRILAFLREQEEERSRREVRIQHADRSGPIPASYAQQRLWLVEQLGSDVPVYNMYFLARFSGRVDTDALRGAVADLVDRHEVMRTGLTEVDGELCQSIADRVPVPFTVHEIDPDDLERVKLDIAATRFDLAAPPLIRFDLLHWDEREWLLMFTQHHVISDGWSTSLIRKELTELYTARLAGRPAELAEVKVQYADYAVWEREWSRGDLARRQRDFWREQLRDLPPLLDLAPARQRPAVQSYRGDLLPFTLPEETLRHARKLAAECQTTLYGVLVAAYSLLLSRISRTEDIAVGSPLASRPYPALENTIGLFFNSITIRSRVDGEKSVREYLAQVRKTAFDAFANQDLPFDRVVREVAPERNTSHSPVFQSVFILQSYPDEPLRLPGTEPGRTTVPSYSAQYDVMFKLRETPDGFNGQLFYNDSLFSHSDAELFVEWFGTALAVMARNLDAPLGTLSLTGDEDRERVCAWNEAARRPLPEEPVHETITRRLRKDPDRPAVSFRGGGLSCGELDDAAARVAAVLRAHGLQPGQRVGVMVPRSPDTVAVLLGIMRAGLTYVPLNGSTPSARVERMLSVAECAALVVDAPYTEACPGFDGERLHLPDLLRGPADPVQGRGPGHFPDESTDAVDGSAYVIFTSGSTGTPKGVEVTHANLVNLFAALDEAVPLPPEPVWLAVTDITFDIAVVELLWTLAQGVPVVLAETAESILAAGDSEEAAALATVPELIRSGKVNAMQATPTLVRSLLRLPDGERALGDLELLMLGGETVDLTLTRTLRALGVRRLLNMYGPTETTVWSTFWEIPEGAERMLVGGALANTELHVLDTSLQPVPVGMYGELCIGGAGVARGYAGDPAQTAERFVRIGSGGSTEQGSEGEGSPVYRTGDIARLLPDGTVELVGRLDHQVKVNGYRIELEEVEQALNAVPGVSAAAVKVRRDPRGDSLVAYYASRDAAGLDPAELRGALEEHLPRQMTPGEFWRVDALPTTTSGKVDRKALPDRPTDRTPGGGRNGRSETPAVAAEGDLEEQLLVLWRRVLADDGVTVTDDFFRSGGNSILVARLLTEVREHVAPGARIVDFFRFPTVRGFAGHLSRPADAAHEGPRNPAQPSASNTARRERRRQVQRKRQAQAARAARKGEE